jgi:16S rRNA (adenine1518-N6/adenine1519-N6)-dimethyltransferase
VCPFEGCQENTNISGQTLTHIYQAELAMTRYGRTAYDTLRSRNLAPKKKFGQNFLVHRQTAEAIVRAGQITADDVVLEVGVGLGALTVPLAGIARHVYGYEIDSGIIRFHQQEGDLPENVSLVHQDILKADFAALARKCGGKLKILANLPYSISNPFIFKLIDNAERIDTATVMLQKEVARRLAAKVASSEYGVPTILLRSCATVVPKLTLGPAEFHPRPRVDSVVITIDFQNKPAEYIATDSYDYRLFTKIVRRTFNQRRKTIANTLSRANVFGIVAGDDKACNKLAATRALAQAGINPMARPETLEVKKFIELTRAVSEINSAPERSL